MTRYKVVIRSSALREIDRLPGHIRSRVRRSVVDLQNQSALPQSKALRTDLSGSRELRRARIDDWRLIYLIDSELSVIYVLAVRRRPPYSYGDISALVQDFE